MFAIIMTSHITNKRKMRALKKKRNIHLGITFEQSEVCGMDVLIVNAELCDGMKEEVLLNKCLYITKNLLSVYVRRVCFSKGCKLKSFFPLPGIELMDEERLYEEMAADMGKRVAKKEYDTAAFFAGVLSLSRERALRELCMDFRYIVTELGDAAKNRIYENMRSKFGVSPVYRKEKNGKISADIAIIFTIPPKRVDFSDNCVIISQISYERLREKLNFSRKITDIEYSIADNNFGEIHPDFPRNIIISEALKQGRISKKDIVIEKIYVNDEIILQ